MFIPKEKKPTALRLSVLEENIMFCLYHADIPLSRDAIKSSLDTLFERSSTDSVLTAALERLIDCGHILLSHDHQYRPAISEDAFRLSLKPHNAESLFSLFIS